MDALQKAINHYGALKALAEAIGVSPQLIVNWRKRGVPPDRAKDIEEATNGIVTRQELRPDIFA